MIADCPPADALFKMLSGDLPADEAQTIELHIGECTVCQQRVETILNQSLHFATSTLHDDLTYLNRVELSPPPVFSVIGMAGRENSTDEDSPNDDQRSAIPRPAIPGYEILKELGRGGMGVVYQARQIRLNRPVALKMILGGTHAGSQARERFLVEAEVVARLRHPNIVLIYQIGEHEGHPFLEMEYVEGGSLSARQMGAPMPPRDAAALVESIAEAMGTAHREGIIHRDLKPANILLTAEGVPKVADFGLAKLIGSDSGVTQSGAIIGSPSYMAPEQALGKIRELGVSVDVYALGAILYECVTGRPPFRGATPTETIFLVRSTEVLAPSRLMPRIPRDLETITLKCLEKDPVRRYAGADALAADLKRYLEGQPIQARRANSLERLIKWAKRRPAIAGLSSLALCAIVSLIAGGFHYNTRLSQSNEDLRFALNRALTAEASAARNAKSAVEQRDIAFKTLNTLVFEVQDKLGKQPTTRALQQSLLDEAIKGLGELARNTQTAEPDESRATAHYKLALIYFDLGKRDESRAQLEQAIPICDQLIRDKKGTARVRVLAAKAINKKGDMLLLVDQPDLAIENYRKSLEILLASNPQEPDRQLLKTTIIQTRLALADAQVWKRDFEGATHSTNEMNGLLSEELAKRPDDPELLALAGRFEGTRLDIHRYQGHFEEALTHGQRSINYHQRVIAVAPEFPQAESWLRNASFNQAALLQGLGKDKEAIAIMETCLSQLKEAETADPALLMTQFRLVVAETNLGETWLQIGEFLKAEPYFKSALARLRKIEQLGALEEKTPYREVILPQLEFNIRLCDASKEFERDHDIIRKLLFYDAYRLLAYRPRSESLQKNGLSDWLLSVQLLSTLKATSKDEFMALAGTWADLKARLARLGPTENTKESLRKALEECANGAKTSLAKSFEVGFDDFMTLKSAPELKPIRDDSELWKLVAERAETLGKSVK